MAFVLNSPRRIHTIIDVSKIKSGTLAYIGRSCHPNFSNEKSKITQNTTLEIIAKRVQKVNFDSTIKKVLSRPEKS